MITDENPLPTTIVGLFSTAFSLYGRRIVLYGTLAVAALAVQYVVDVVLPHTTGLVAGLQIVVDSFIDAAVAIGVAFDVAHQDADWSTVVSAASLRWGVVAVVNLVYAFLVILFLPDVFGSDQDTYGLLVLPVIVMWGAVSLATVVAAIEPSKSRLLLPALALGKAVRVSFRFVNLGRLIILSVILTLPLFAGGLLEAQFSARHLADPSFWAEIPVDALAIGPLQALSTIFYIDFLRRANSPKR